MKLKKLLLTVTAGTLLLASLTACGSKNDKKDKQTTTENQNILVNDDDATGSGAYMSFNGTDLQVGTVWNDVKDSLGSEAKPSETIEPCGGGDYIQIVHFYDGLTVTTLRDETIVSLEIPMDGESTAAVNGTVTKGSSADDVKAALGDTPNMEDEYMISYTFGNVQVNINLDNGKVNSAMFMSLPE